MRTPRSRRRRFARASACIVGLALLTGCQLRLDTPEPTEPVPTADEALRRAAVDDALLIRDLAQRAGAATQDPRVTATLEEVAEFAGEHTTALGGPYESGLQDAATASPTPTQAPDATTETVIAALVEATTQAQQAADATDNGELARLFASIGASDKVSARRLAGLTSSSAVNAPSAATVPASAPRGLTADELTAIVAAEDQAGYAGEVRAALLDDDARAAAYARSQEHRQRAQSWALAAGIADGKQDPRRIAYELPDDVISVAFAQRLETSLAGDYAALVGHAAAGSRINLSRLLGDAATAAVAFGAPPVAFPGMADLAASAPSTPSTQASPSATTPAASGAG